MLFSKLVIALVEEPSKDQQKLPEISLLGACQALS